MKRRFTIIGLFLMVLAMVATCPIWLLIWLFTGYNAAVNLFDQLEALDF